MASLELPSTSQEPTTPVDDDSFAAAAHYAASLLESPIVAPDAESFEVLRVPFGRFGDGGTLAADMTWSSNALSGRLIYTPHDTTDKGRIHVTRRPIDTDWRWLNYDGQLPNGELASRLRADWPAGDDGFRAASQGVDDRTMYTELRDGLLNLTPPIGKPNIATAMTN